MCGHYGINFLNQRSNSQALIKHKLFYLIIYMIRKIHISHNMLKHTSQIISAFIALSNHVIVMIKVFN